MTKAAKAKKTIAKPDRLIPRSGLKDKGCDWSATKTWRLIRAGEIPQPVVIGGRQYWLESELDAWIASLAAARGGKQRGAAA